MNMNWLLQWRYRRRLAWCKKNDVLHYALVEAGRVEDVMRWSKKKLLWMRDVDRYLARSESRITKYVDKEVRDVVEAHIKRIKGKT